ncbi:hypothetical protein BC833DRAFT_596290 [Globomyces pollinis-pini]|nr:hypothetical protein BC833DRAFT_596290 [Globomyces pollinis-pini]
MQTPPSEYHHINLKMNANYNSNANNVSQFIATNVYCLVYKTTPNPNHPAMTSFRKYIDTILSQTSNNVTSPVIFVSLLYVSRYMECAKYYNYPKSSINPVKLWTTALMLADVTLNDAAYAVKSWSQVTEIPVRECIYNRKCFMELIKYDLNVTEVQYAEWIDSLKRISRIVSSLVQQQYPSQYHIPSQMVCQPLMRTHRQSLCISPTSAIGNGWIANPQTIPSPPGYYPGYKNPVVMNQQNIPQQFHWGQ